MIRIKELFVFTAKGYSDLKKSIWAAIFKKLCSFLPFTVIYFLIKELLLPMEAGSSLSQPHIIMLAFSGVICFLIMLLSVQTSYRSNHIPAYREMERLRNSVAERMRLLPMCFFNAHDISELSNHIMSDCAVCEVVMSRLIPNMTANFICVIVILVIMAFFNVTLSLAAFCVIPAAFAVELLSLKAQATLTQRQLEAKRKASGTIQEYLDGMKIIKTYGLTGERCQQLRSALDSVRQASMRLELTSGIFVSGSDVIVQLGVGIVIFAASCLLVRFKVDLLSALLFFAVVLRLYEPVSAEIGMFSEMTYAWESLARLKKLFEIPIISGDSLLVPSSFDIEFRDISFRYDQRSNFPNILEHVSFKVVEGSITTLVGPSGGGKSTIARLIAGFWDANQGDILIGGISIREMAPETLNSYISIVFQNVVLFNDTIYNNIRIGNPSATREQILSAAEAAQCSDFISRLEHGYETVVAENGLSLSGGERQRISIARAILKNAPILLLDEATASLDPENEELVQRALSNLVSQGKTVVMIAHRFRTVVDADQILVVEKGIITEHGTHDALLKAGGTYRRLYDLQQESQNWTI